MENKKLGIAIIGAGAIAGVHIDAYKRYPDRCEVRAVCDIFTEKAQQLIDQYGLENAVAVKDFHDILSDDRIDAVSICLPPSLHAPTAIDCLNGGKHVICEKPMAGSLEECDQMIKAADENGKLLSIVTQNRYKTPHMKTKQLLDAGAIGPVLFASINSFWWRGENYYDLWWRGTWEKESGGCVINHAVHHIDMMQWMLGMPKEVNAVISNVGHSNSECEDVAIATLSYPHMMVQMTATILTHSEDQEMIFHGKKASIAVPWRVSACKAMPNGFPEADEAVRAEVQAQYDALPDLKVEGHPAQIANFLLAINGEAKLLVDGQEARNTMELITAIYKSACFGRSVRLPLPTNDVFYRKGGIAAVMPHFNEKTKSVENLAASKPITLGRDVGG